MAQHLWQATDRHRRWSESKVCGVQWRWPRRSRSTTHGGTPIRLRRGWGGKQVSRCMVHVRWRHPHFLARSSYDLLPLHPMILGLRSILIGSLHRLISYWFSNLFLLWWLIQSLHIVCIHTPICTHHYKQQRRIYSHIHMPKKLNTYDNVKYKL